MRLILLISFLACLFLFFMCTSDKTKICSYTLDQVLSIDTPRVFISYKNDTLVEVHDKGRNSSMGLYVFDKKENLRFYGFRIDSTHYQFSEEYDGHGNIIQSSGSPLLEYRLWKISDSILLINASLFGLNRKYDSISITSNHMDTIRPESLYRSDFFSNVKVFSFKINVTKNVNDLIFFAYGHYWNTCTNNAYSFRDTVSFSKVKLSQ